MVFGQKLMVYLGLITCAVAISFYVVMLKRSKTKVDEVEAFLGAKAEKQASTEENNDDNT
jgi:N-acetylneuraminic acid mutarotase